MENLESAFMNIFKMIPPEGMDHLDQLGYLERKQKLIDIKNKEYEKVFSSYVNRFIRNQIKLKQAPSYLQEIADIVHQQDEQLNAIQTEKEELKATDNILITISPPPNVEVKEFKKVIEKVNSKKWMTDYITVIEQRGKTEEDIKGPHAHILINRDGKPLNHIKREIMNTTKNLIDYGECPHALDVKFLKTPEDVERARNYLIGSKKDPEKQEKQRIDVIFREKYGIKPFYSPGYMLNPYKPST